MRHTLATILSISLACMAGCHDVEVTPTSESDVLEIAVDDDSAEPIAGDVHRVALAPIESHADGQVTVGDRSYDSRAAFHLSEQFRAEGRRCGAHQPQVSFFSPSDCSLTSTSIEPEYEPSTVLEIPVVYHVIERTTGEGAISEDLLRSQLDILNEDFRALAGTPGEQGADSGIQFTLAAFDPDGNPTDGINRVVNNTYFNDRGGFKSALNWDTTRYLNIYTNSASGYLGYATFPQEDAGTSVDGVVILHEAVGRDAPDGGIYNQGRTGTHEVGHYLGLFHTFQSGCGSLAAPYSTADLIADTTPTRRASYDCIVEQSECNGVTDPAPIENYMEYTNDTCMTRFTPEQINRMRCSIAHYRGGLINAAPGASFTHERDGLDVQFTDLSSDQDGEIAAWEWDLGDGNTSTEPSPLHSYETSGMYAVTLTITDNRGSRAAATMDVLANARPLASFTHTAAGLAVEFVDTSRDDNGSVQSWAWNFGDGATSAEQNPSHGYQAEGSYRVQLTVTDDAGDTATTEVEVAVTSATPNDPEDDPDSGSEDGGCSAGGSGGTAPWGSALVIGLALILCRRKR